MKKGLLAALSLLATLHLSGTALAGQARVETGQNYAEMTFDWDQPVSVSMGEAAGIYMLQFSDALQTPPAALRERLGRWVKAVERGGNERELLIELPLEYQARTIQETDQKVLFIIEPVGKLGSYAAAKAKNSPAVAQNAAENSTRQSSNTQTAAAVAPSNALSLPPELRKAANARRSEPQSPSASANDSGSEVIQLIKAAPVTATAPSPSAPKATVQSVGLQGGDISAASVAVRAGRHADKGRLVFDVPAATGYSVNEHDNGFTIMLDHNANFGVQSAVRIMKQRLSRGEATVVNGRSFISFDYKSPQKLKHFALKDGRIVVDLMDPATQRSATPRVDAKGPVSSPALIDQAAETREASIDRNTEFRPQQAALSSQVDGSSASSVGSFELPTALPELVSNRSGALTESGSLLTYAIREPQRIELYFDWDVAVSSAVFQRAGYLWAVFDATMATPTDVFPDGVEGALGPAQYVDTDRGTAFRIPLKRGTNLAVSALDETRWRIDLVDGASQPRPVLEEPLEKPLRLRYPEAGDPIVLTDPAIGDQLGILPLQSAGNGMPATRSLVDLKLLATAQGIVYRPNVADLTTIRVGNGVEITRPDGGLRLSPRFALNQ